MLQELVNHNEDLRKLQDEGYELEENGGYLVIHHIPYVANENGIPTPKNDGMLVAKLNLSGNNLNKPFPRSCLFELLINPLIFEPSILHGHNPVKNDV